MKPYVVEESSDARQVPRRIALIRRETPARLHKKPAEVVPTAPHLILREVILIQVCVIVLALIALAFDAPLEEIADPQHTPNPAKAPWYFLGLQEMLHYFPPVVAGVLLPSLVVIALAVIPYFRVNIEIVGLYERPWKRTLGILTAIVAVGAVPLVLSHAWPVLIPTVLIYGLLVLPALPFSPDRVKARLAGIPLADWIMTWFLIVAVTLTLIGILFRGPGWSWTWPWKEGIY
jgi:quinol-cytochrome oxidoreductase complex cytochrome b subunit